MGSTISEGGPYAEINTLGSIEKARLATEHRNRDRFNRKSSINSQSQTNFGSVIESGRFYTAEGSRRPSIQNMTAK